MTPAVPSGRRVIERPALSLKVYISFCTTSVVSPTERLNSSVCSKVGMRISPKPHSAATSRAVSSRYCHLPLAGGSTSCVPRGAFVRYAIAFPPQIDVLLSDHCPCPGG